MAGELIARVFVPGRPRTKGSLKPVLSRSGGKVRASLTESGEYSIPWKKTMMRALAAECRRTGTVVDPYAEAVEVHAFFRFERLCLPDQTLPWPVRREGEYAHGDVDKLWRNVLDALEQSHVLADDALVVGGTPHKRWCEPGERAGVLIVVTAASHFRDVLALERAAMEIA